MTNLLSEVICLFLKRNQQIWNVEHNKQNKKPTQIKQIWLSSGDKVFIPWRKFLIITLDVW